MVNENEVVGSGLLVICIHTPYYLTFKMILNSHCISSLNVSASALSDIDGLGSSAIGGQLIRKASTQSPFTSDKNGSDNMVAGKVHARQALLPK